jgi:hypothetical protein
MRNGGGTINQALNTSNAKGSAKTGISTDKNGNSILNIAGGNSGNFKASKLSGLGSNTGQNTGAGVAQRQNTGGNVAQRQGNAGNVAQRQNAGGNVAQRQNNGGGAGGAQRSTTGNTSAQRTGGTPQRSTNRASSARKR